MLKERAEARQRSGVAGDVSSPAAASKDTADSSDGSVDVPIVDEAMVSAPSPVEAAPVAMATQSGGNVTGASVDTEALLSRIEQIVATRMKAERAVHAQEQKVLLSRLQVSLLS